MIAHSRRGAIELIGAFALSIAIGSPTRAQHDTSGAIRIIVPTPPGSPPDILCRILANELSASEGWQVVVENRPGAIQTLGVAEVLKLPADGRTLLAMTLPMFAAPALLPDRQLTLGTDLAPVIKLSTGYNVLVVHPSVPAHSVRELVDLLKSRPGKLNFASGGIGNPAHLIGELFKRQTGTQATHVPYPQGGPFVADLISGTTQFSFISTVRVVDLVHAGKLRALAVMGPKRVAALKDVPTIVEQGFPDLVVEDWVGIGVKSGTADATVTRLNAASNKALAKTAVRESFEKVGHEPVGGSPYEFGKLIHAQLAYWKAVIQHAAIKAH